MPYSSILSLQGHNYSVRTQAEVNEVSASRTAAQVHLLLADLLQITHVECYIFEIRSD